MTDSNDQSGPESHDEKKSDPPHPDPKPVTSSDPTQILPAAGSTLLMPSNIDPGDLGESDSQPEPNPGDQLGRYQIQRTLGSGGMGQVLQVHDERLDRIIAAKTLRQASSSDFQQRFTREARVTGHLEHPNIVPIHDLEVDESGNLFYTMKRVRGVELATVLQRDLKSRHSADSAQRLEQRLRIFLKACDAMSFAHSQGVIHRDLKPANIMVGEFGEVLVMDWGLAKMNWRRKSGAGGDSKPPEDSASELEENCLSSLTPKSILSTQEGQILGTIPYMPPEQANGLIDQLDPRSDIYSLGAILYEMLTGSPPYNGRKPTEVLAQVIRGDLEPPSKRRPDLAIPWELEQIVLKAMASDPERRYQRVEHLQNDLEQFLGGQLVAAAQYNPIQILSKWIGRHKPMVLSVGAIAGLVLGLAIAWFFTPGTLHLQISPTGARIQIDDRTWVATQKPLFIRLPAGAYSVRIESPDHQSETREILIERGRSKDLSTALRHDTGTLTILADPPETRIEVGSQQFGSRIPSIALPTGRHSIHFWAPNHFEKTATTKISNTTHPTIYRYLDRGMIWQFSSSSIQAGDQVITLPDLDQDGAPDLAVRELTHLSILSGYTGALLDQIPEVATNSRWTLIPGPLTPNGTRSIWIHGEEKYGLSIAQYDFQAGSLKQEGNLQRDDRWTWKWTSPLNRNWPDPRRGSACPGPDLTGDGEREWILVERDGRLWILDGTTGQPIGAPHQLPARPFERNAQRSPGLALSGTHKNISPLLFAGPALSNPSDSATPPILAGALNLQSGEILWKRSFQGTTTTWLIDQTGDAHKDVVFLSPKGWQVVDGLTGKVLHTGTIGQPAEPFQPHLGDLDGDGILDLIASTGNQLIAQKLTQAQPLWSSSQNIRGNIRFLFVKGYSRLFAPTATGFSALDGATGHPIWRAKTPTIDTLVLADWDRDGLSDLLVSLPGHGLQCWNTRGQMLWSLRLEGATRPVSLLPDYDGDGRKEIVLYEGESEVSQIRGPRFLWSQKARGPLQATPQVLDLDGRLEVVQLGSWHGGQLARFDGFSGHPIELLPSSQSPNRSPTVGDWDGDGLDLVYLETFAKTSQITIRTATKRWIHLPLKTHCKAYAVGAVCDLNGDGQPDFALQRWDPADIVAIDGRTGSPLWNIPTQSPNMGGLKVADMDGDNQLDIVAPSGDGHVYCIRGRDGHILWKHSIGLGGSYSPPTLYDLDGDGIPECLLMTRQGHFFVLRGTDGKPLAHKTGGTSVTGSPVAFKTPRGRTLILIPAGSGGFFVMDWPHQTILWKSLSGFYISSTPRVADLDGDGNHEVILVHTRFTQTKDQNTIDVSTTTLSVVDLYSGTILWKIDLGVGRTEMIEGDPVLADFDGNNILDILVASKSGRLLAIDGSITSSARKRAVQASREK